MACAGDFYWTAGGTTCAPCPALSTSPPGTPSPDGCLCEYGTFKVFSLNASATIPFTCEPCPSGAICSPGDPPLAIEGYWHIPDDRSAFYSCSPGLCEAESVSDEDNCAPRQAGVVCGLCAPGFALQGSRCEACSSVGAITSWPLAKRAGLAVGAAVAALLLTVPLFLYPLLPLKWFGLKRSVSVIDTDDMDSELAGGHTRAITHQFQAAAQVAIAARRMEGLKRTLSGDSPTRLVEGLSRTASGGGGSLPRSPRTPLKPWDETELEEHRTQTLRLLQSNTKSLILEEPGTIQARSSSLMGFLFAALWANIEPMRITADSVQIISSFQLTMRVPWPDIFYAFSSRLSFINMSFLKLPKTGCATPNVNYLQTFNGYTCGVAASICYILLLWAGGEAYCRHRKLSHLVRSEFVSVILARLLLFSDLVYAPVSEIVLGIYSCRKIGDNWYLNPDLSVLCYTPEHYRYMRLGGFWIALYPIGIPVFFAGLLWYYRIPRTSGILRRTALLRQVVELAWHHGVQQPPDVVTSMLSCDNITDEHLAALCEGLLCEQVPEPSTPGGLSDSLPLDGANSREARLERILAWGRARLHRTHFGWNVLSFNPELDRRREGYQVVARIYEPFLPSRWMFKLIELSYKLIVTCALQFVQPGSSAQVVAGVFLSLIYHIVYQRMLPYADKCSRQIAFTHTIVILLLFIGALLLRLEVPIVNDRFLAAYVAILWTAVFAVPVFLIARSGKLQLLWRSREAAGGGDAHSAKA